jgi:eukaryotic-like serine/threonine-protein kinase
MLVSGSHLGRYRIMAPLGAGGMGEVYRATDSRLDRQVAIKVLPPQFVLDKDRLARFEREAKAVAALSHPNILGIHDFGTEQGQNFAVMELLEGQTLRQRMEETVLPWRKAVEIALAIADGLAAAHAKGIIHRDLKPDNIFLTADGRVKILAFGLARIEPPTLPSGDTPTNTFHPAQTEAGMILGTVGYMSPEQVRAQEVDVRSDIFSLGCVLYEMVGGEKAFARQSAIETMTAILHEEPPDLAESGKHVPLELNRLIGHCLEKSREQRFQSAHDLAYALKAVLHSSNAAERIAVPRRAAGQSSRFWIAASAMLLAVAVGSGWLLVSALRNKTAAVGITNPAHLFDSLAILPLRNVTEDPNGDPLCEGIAEQLTSSLSQVRQIKVRPITSTAHYHKQTVDAKTVGRELDVKAVVIGRLRQDGEALVISLELIDARDNSLFWSNRYTGNRQEILDLQDQLTRDLAAQLGLHLTGEDDKRITRRYTEDPEAFLLYSEGMFHWNKFTEEALATAMDCFRQAIQKDPNYAVAYSGLGRCYVLSGAIHRGPRSTHPEAKKLFLQALKLDNNLAHARSGLGSVYMFHDWDWPAAERELKQSAEIDLSMYGFYHAAHGRLAEAHAAIRRSQELDPLAPRKRNELAMSYNWMRRHDDAIIETEKALKLDPNFLLAYAERAHAQVDKGMFEEAISGLQAAITRGQRHCRVRGMLGYAYAKAGQTESAREVLDALKQPAPLRFGCAFAIARIHAVLGEKDQAFEWLTKACEERDSGVIWLKVDTTLDNLRSDPRFDAILQNIGLASDIVPRTSL